jgi:hypothetical protein
MSFKVPFDQDISLDLGIKFTDEVIDDIARDSKMVFTYNWHKHFLSATSKADGNRPFIVPDQYGFVEDNSDYQYDANFGWEQVFMFKNYSDSDARGYHDFDMCMLGCAAANSFNDGFTTNQGVYNEGNRDDVTMSNFTQLQTAGAKAFNYFSEMQTATTGQVTSLEAGNLENSRNAKLSGAERDCFGLDLARTQIDHYLSGKGPSDNVEKCESMAADPLMMIQNGNQVLTSIASGPVSSAINEHIKLKFKEMYEANALVDLDSNIYGAERLITGGPADAHTSVAEQIYAQAVNNGDATRIGRLGSQPGYHSILQVGDQLVWQVNVSNSASIGGHKSFPVSIVLNICDHSSDRDDSLTRAIDVYQADSDANSDAGDYLNKYRKYEVVACQLKERFASGDLENYLNDLYNKNKDILSEVVRLSEDIKAHVLPNISGASFDALSNLLEQHRSTAIIMKQSFVEQHMDAFKLESMNSATVSKMENVEQLLDLKLNELRELTGDIATESSNWVADAGSAATAAEAAEAAALEAKTTAEANLSTETTALDGVLKPALANAQKELVDLKFNYGGDADYTTAISEATVKVQMKESQVAAQTAVVAQAQAAYDQAVVEYKAAVAASELADANKDLISSFDIVVDAMNGFIIGTDTSNSNCGIVSYLDDLNSNLVDFAKSPMSYAGYDHSTSLAKMVAPLYDVYYTAHLCLNDSDTNQLVEVDDWFTQAKSNISTDLCGTVSGSAPEEKEESYTFVSTDTEFSDNISADGTFGVVAGVFDSGLDAHTTPRNGPEPSSAWMEFKGQLGMDDMVNWTPYERRYHSEGKQRMFTEFIVVIEEEIKSESTDTSNETTASLDRIANMTAALAHYNMELANEKVLYAAIIVEYNAAVAQYNTYAAVGDRSFSSSPGEAQSTLILVLELLYNNLFTLSIEVTDGDDNTFNGNFSAFKEKYGVIDSRDHENSQNALVSFKSAAWTAGVGDAGGL